jgi:hypothetical protein
LPAEDRLDFAEPVEEPLEPVLEVPLEPAFDEPPLESAWDELPEPLLESPLALLVSLPELSDLTFFL